VQVFFVGLERVVVNGRGGVGLLVGREGGLVVGVVLGRLLLKGGSGAWSS